MDRTKEFFPQVFSTVVVIGKDDDDDGNLTSLNGKTFLQLPSNNFAFHTLTKAEKSPSFARSLDRSDYVTTTKEKKGF